MLFNSLQFLLIFLPLIYALFAVCARHQNPRAASLALAVASLGFWSYWEPRQLWFIVLSILVNWMLSRLISASIGKARSMYLAAGLTFNLCWLLYFKYAGFLGGIVLGQGDPWLHSVLDGVMLPLGISFFTFQKIAYLMDAHDNPAQEPADLLRFSLFVLFFPQLIAGPIVHHRELMPQLAVMTRRFRSRAYGARFLVPGLILLVLGLSKKVLIADSLAPFADDPFLAARSGDLSFLEAWGAAIAYSLQLYFDFSGYSEMALGLGLLFGIRLPLNFNAPYRADSIVEFWRRWHMTLSRFLRDYLYVPLGGNRKGAVRRQLNLMITMILGGLWHGAAWTFVIWGAVHGVLLVLNHLWRRIAPFSMPRFMGLPLTMAAVAAAWVVFRADGMDAAIRIWKGMIGMSGVVLPSTYASLLPSLPGIEYGEIYHFAGLRQLALCGLGLALIWGAPPAHRVLDRRVHLALGRSIAAPILLGLAFAACLALMFIRPNVTFLYFQF